MVTHTDRMGVFGSTSALPPASKAIVLAIISDLIHGYVSGSILSWMIGFFIVLTCDPP